MEDRTIPEDHPNEELRGRDITAADTGRMLGAGWLLFMLSQMLNYLYYKMHPSSPEMGTWGKAEIVQEEWVEDWSGQLLWKSKPRVSREKGELQIEYLNYLICAFS